MMIVHDAASTGADRDVRRAWWSLVLFGPSLVAAFVVGEVLLAALGHGGDETVPAGVALQAGVPAMLVFALPTLLVWYFARQARRHGHPEGRTPAVVAVAISGGFVALNLLQLLARLFV